MKSAVFCQRGLRFQKAAYHRHAKTRVIHIGIAGNDDDVARIPAELIHLCPRHRQIGRYAIAFGPIFGVREQGAALVREQRLGR